MAAADLSATRLRELLHYDPDTGVFQWRVQRPKAVPGKTVGSIQAIGYLVIRVDARLHYGHRLAWLYMTGAWPSRKIDHRDGQKHNNCWANLRDVEDRVNAENVRQARCHGVSGHLGANKTKWPDKWRAIITVRGKQKHLGIFADPAEASAAYVEAKRKLHEGNTL
jgi:hypothetical protein